MITNACIALKATTIASLFVAVGIGDSDASESASHTDLQASTNKVRKEVTGTTVQTTISGDTAQWQVTFSSSDDLTGSWNINEVGVFTSTVGGTMDFRKKLTVTKPVNWGDGDTLIVTAKDQVKQGT